VDELINNKEQERDIPAGMVGDWESLMHDLK
jgi:hypothetical protein